ncbi:hypothetical protein ACQKKX_19745 [Neorhizobium sp. NPDC001467]|uniref:hypothetical protein n=1 Tax=Neorhizobium sp. NPDC001467 TaxID=3390595 RepID=UPI003D06A795
MSNTASLTVELTPTQVRGLKLAKDGDLFPQEGNRWTHLNAQVTYAPSDRFKERPRAIKTSTTATVNQLREYGLLRELDPEVAATESAHGITMAGKMWLLKHK